MSAPDAIQAELQEAARLHGAGQLDRAAALYDRVLARAPGNVDALYLSGKLALDRGEARRALTLLRLARGLTPNAAPVHVSLGVARAALGDRVAAEACYRHALTLDPQCAMAHLRLGEALLDAGNATAAAEHAAAAVAADPDLAAAWQLIGRIAAQNGQHEAAAKAYRMALRHLPQHADLHVGLGQAQMAAGLHAEAAQSFRNAVTLKPADAAAWHGLGTALIAMHALDEGIAAFRTALSHEPERADTWNSLAEALAIKGDTQEAIAALRRVVTLRPDAAPAWRSLAAAGAVTFDADLLARLTAQFDDPALPQPQQLAAAFAAVLMLDRAGREEQAFPILAAAKTRLRRSEAVAGRIFDPEVLARYVDHRINGFTRNFLAIARDGVPHPELPVFVVGMPRSGTTLVEQILASHPVVHGVGEGPAIGALETALPHHPEGLNFAAWNPDMARAVARGHLTRLAAQAPPGTLRVVDKTPDNIFHLGLIAALFPGARIIFCERDPRDICLSCYFQWFLEPLAFANDLTDCATRLLAVDRLRRHWDAVLPCAMTTVRYERLIAAPEAEARRLIAFLGLDWDPACLEFHRNGQPVRSSSLWQVRRPIYDRSVGRWRRYQRFLGPLIAAFGGADQPLVWPEPPAGQG